MSRSIFFFFFVVVVYSILPAAKHCTSVKTNETLVTDGLIQDICSHTRNPSLCIQTLSPFKGHNLSNNPLVTLGSMARNAARKTTHAAIVSLHAKIKDSTRIQALLKQKQRYYKCHVKFSDVRTRLTNAMMEMKGGNMTNVRTNIAMAMSSIDACLDEFNRPPPEPSNVAKDVKVGGVCSIIKAICDELVRLSNNLADYIYLIS